MRMIGYYVGVWIVATVAMGCSVQTVRLLSDDMRETSSKRIYRWLNVADQPYGQAFRETYRYDKADVRIIFSKQQTGVFRAKLVARGLKPHFAYQIKLVGQSGRESNERIGQAGRWWQFTWNGREWPDGQNLNDKGDGRSPSPNDTTYLQRRDSPDATSPTGKKYRYTGYLVMDFFVTDSTGHAEVEFLANSSFHVFWKTTQRKPEPRDGAVRTVSIDPDPAQSPAYDQDHPSAEVTLFGEWERLPVGGATLPPGDYDCHLMLTEESFHSSGGKRAGCWAEALVGDLTFNLR